MRKPPRRSPRCTTASSSRTGRVQHGFGHYEETYALDEGAWRIARMTLRRLRIVGDTASERSAPD